MGTLNNRFQYVWYGTCTEHDAEGCKPYIFSQNTIQLKSAVELISTFGPGPLNSAEFFKPDTEEGTLTSMECGVMYSVVLKPGKTFTLPGLTPAGTETIKSGQNQFPSAISFTCENVYEPTPTPSPFACIPTTSEYEKVKITSLDHNELINGVFQGFQGFSNNDIVGLDMTWFVSALSSTIIVDAPSIGFSANIELGGIVPKSAGGGLYLQRGDSCFRGPFRLVGSTWHVTLQLINGELPTPTPVLDPTPTPVPSCLCAPGNYEVVKITGLSMNHSGHAFKGFTNGVEVSYDENTLTTAVSSQVSLNYPNSSFAGLIELGGGQPNNTAFYVKHGNKCYTATATSSNGSGGVWNLTMSVSKTLSSNCGDDDPLPTPTPKEPTPTPAVGPTPTPISSAECCPDSHTSLDTVGGLDSNSHSYTPPGGNKMTLLTWKGFAAGGKLCVDLTLADGWSHSGFESTRRVYLNSESSPQIGTIKKSLNNGTARNDIYYVDDNNKCWSGEYGEDVVVLT